MTKTNTKFFRNQIFVRELSKKIIFWITVTLLCMLSLLPRGYAHAQDASASVDAGSSAITFPYKKIFVISSYYSPLPNQTKYVTGSYESDIRLNGGGVHGADGTSVYPGMIAAPSIFPFGTKMQIPGIGTVAVHDRGGAIKGNRLDIWVGEGEIGLRRALAWGLRSVEVTVYGLNSSIKEQVNIDSLPLASLERIGIPASKIVFIQDISFGDEGYAVLLLQTGLKRLGYLDFQPNGYFDSTTREAVTGFQLEKGVIVAADDSGSGNVGPKTQTALTDALAKIETQLLSELPTESFGQGTKGDAVLRLKKVLVHMGILEKADDLFDVETRQAIISLQLEYGIIANSKERSAGYYGPKTQAIFKNTARAYTLSSSQLQSKASNVFEDDLEQSAYGSNVTLLQEELRAMHFLGVASTGYYGKTTEHAVTKFQEAFGIIQNEKDLGAGIAGPQTRQKLNEIIASRLGQTKLVAQVSEQRTIVVARIEGERKLIAGIKTDAFTEELTYGMNSKKIQNLQLVLKRLGFFPGRLTSDYFGTITKNALISFQKSHGLDQSGVLDERTRSILNRVINGPQAS